MNKVKNRERTTKQAQVRRAPAGQLITVTGGALNPIMPIPGLPGESVTITPVGGGSEGSPGVIVTPTGGGSGGSPGVTVVPGSGGSGGSPG